VEEGRRTHLRLGRLAPAGADLSRRRALGAVVHPANFDAAEDGFAPPARYLGALRVLAYVTCLCCAASLAFAASASAADSVFWTDSAANQLGRAALDGSGGVALTPASPAPNQPYGTAIDAASGRVYWANAGADQIDSAALDGGEAAVLNTAGAETAGPEGLAIDPAAGRIYWANISNRTIAWAALDGSGGGTFDTTGAPIAEPSGVAIDPAAGRIYWASYGLDEIGWANLSGGGAGTLPLPASLLHGPTGIAIDPAAGRIYWTNWKTGSIAWASLAGVGSGEVPIGVSAPREPTGLALDPAAGRLYWADESGFIGTVPLPGGAAAKLALPGVSPVRPSFPALLEAPSAAPAQAPVATVGLGATMACATVAWEPDLVESFLYRAPRSVAYAWTLDGRPVPGADAPTLVATGPGEYACRATATNGAGSTDAAAGVFNVNASASPATGEAGGGGGAAAAASTAEPSKASLPRVTKVSLDRRQGVATLTVRVDGSGLVTLSGKQVIGRRATASGTGMARLKVASKGGARKALVASGRVKVHVTVRFDPLAGPTAAADRAIVLRRRSAP
jgi:hypothetical protein